MPEEVNTPAGEGSAAAQLAGGDGKPKGEQPTPQGEQPTQGSGEQPQSSASAQLAGGDGKPKGEQPTPKGEPPVHDLGKMSDEEYAKIVQPDVAGEEVDRTLITPMAKELRAAGIAPETMAKVAGIYRKVVDAEVAKAEADRAARMKALTEKCLKEVTDEEKRDFAAAYREHIAKDETLKALVDTTELGSSPSFIRLIALAGAALRVARPTPASASAGSGQHDTDRAVFEATVPPHLR